MRIVRAAACGAPATGTATGRPRIQLTALGGGARDPEPGTQGNSRTLHADLHAVLQTEAGTDAVAAAFGDDAQALGLPGGTTRNRAVARAAVAGLLAGGHGLPTLSALLLSASAPLPATPPS